MSTAKYFDHFQRHNTFYFFKQLHFSLTSQVRSSVQVISLVITLVWLSTTFCIKFKILILRAQLTICWHPNSHSHFVYFTFCLHKESSPLSFCLIMCFFFFFFNANKFILYSVSSLRHLSWNSTVPVVASYPGSFQDIFTSAEHTSPRLAANTPWKVRVLTLCHMTKSQICLQFY